MSEEVIEPTNEPTEKTLTQTEVDKIVADRVARERRKHEKKLDGVDLEKYQKWQQDQETAELERQKEKGEFEKVLKQTAEKKDAEIQRLKKMVTNNEVDGAILRAAESGQAVAPTQVSELLKQQVRLSDEGRAEVVDKLGNTRYGENGEPLTVKELVGDFLTTNPHFVKATQGGAGSAGNVGGVTQKPKSVGDMSMSEYADYRRTIGRGRNTGGYIKPS